MVAALEAMDDRVLRDIGVNRNDIRRVVAEFDDRELRMVPVAQPSNVKKEDQNAFRLAA